ncbi:MAG TPA: Cu(I)-responsive transcriptional regulator [Casimicrobiaceae bacterium]
MPKIVATLKADPPGWYRTNKLNAARVAATSVETKQQEHPKTSDPVEQHETMLKHQEQMRRMHLDMLWVHFLNVLLGAWLATSPFVFGTFDQASFSDAVLRVTEERGLWDPALRTTLTAWSDLLSGVLIVGFGVLSLSQRFAWAQWVNAAVGIWLLFSPLVFWSPSAAVYANDTLTGALVITFAILVPMMPGMSREGMMDSSDTPTGWTYSPSTYLQRLPIVALGAVGFFIARTLAAYQLGHIDGVWEPLNSSHRSLRSPWKGRSMKAGLNIGSVGEAAGVPPKTIRYYESIGLIAAPRRHANGYRSYSEIDMRTLAFIKRARSLGFSVDEVRELLDLWRDKSRKSATVQALAMRHIEALDRKIAELKSMRKAVAYLVERCHGDARPDCPILGELDKG